MNLDTEFLEKLASAEPAPGGGGASAYAGALAAALAAMVGNLAVGKPKYADEQEGILKYLIEGGDLSLYGLSNAVTRASQDVASYDRATALEGIGWQVATMEPAQWKEINQ